MQKTDLKIKAKELVEKFIPHAKNWDCYHDEPLEENHAKQCALIACDEIINALRKDFPEIGLGKGYWYDIKKEIQKL